MSLIGILVNVLIILLILGVCWYVAKYVAGKLNAPPPVMTFLDILFAIVALLLFLSVVTGYGGRVWVVA